MNYIGGILESIQLIRSSEFFRPIPWDMYHCFANVLHTGPCLLILLCALLNDYL